MKYEILKNSGLLNETDVYQHSNSYLFNDIKRIVREFKRTELEPDKEYPKTFYKSLLKKIDSGQAKRREDGEKGIAKLGTSAQREKILDDIFGSKQRMLAKDFESAIHNYAENYPVGDPVTVSPETAYQTTQRLIADKDLNKTISSSIASSFLKKMADDFKDVPDFDEAFRSIDKNLLAGHFQESTAFIRYTLLSNNWLHFDAFQTDFFNKLRKLKFNLKEKDTTVIKIIDYMLGKQKEFFKSILSYIVRQHKNVKQFTANTASIAKKVENVKNDSKLRELYEELPKELGFEKKSLEDIIKIASLRPGVESTKVITKFSNALSNKKNKDISLSLIEEALKKIADTYENVQDIENEELDSFISNNFPDTELVTFFHQILDDLVEAINRGEIENFFSDNQELILNTKQRMNSYAEAGTELWWSVRGLIFEKNTIVKLLNSLLNEQYENLSAKEICNRGKVDRNFDFKEGLEELIKKDETGRWIYWAGIDWEQFDYRRGLEGLIEKDETGRRIYWAGKGWKEFDYRRGLEALIKKDETGRWIYSAGIDWKEFDFKRGLEVLKKLNNKYYEEALKNWPKSATEKIDTLGDEKVIPIKRKKL